MLRIIFVDDDGGRREVEATHGETLLAVARRHRIAVEGACQGSLSCATCHVIVEPRDYGRLPPPRADEEDMLDLAFGLTATSRLCCQIVVTEALDGLTVRVAPGYPGGPPRFVVDRYRDGTQPLE